MIKDQRNWRRTIIAVAFSIHAMLAALGSFGVPFYKMGIIGEGITYYQTLTGAGRGFGFFAPKVGTQTRALFDLYENDVLKETVDLTKHLSPGGKIRYINGFSNFWQYIEAKKPDLIRAFGASWAAKTLAHHPTADKTVLRFEVYDLPSSEQYRAGAVARWLPLYEAEYRVGNSL